MQYREWQLSVVSQWLTLRAVQHHVINSQQNNRKHQAFISKIHAIMNSRQNQCRLVFSPFLWIGMCALIVCYWRMWRIHLMHPSKWAEWRTWNEGCLPRILQTFLQTSFRHPLTELVDMAVEIWSLPMT